MYGMVNQGIQEFVTRNHGGAVWSDICAQAGVGENGFEMMTAYDDHVTYSLVGAICAKLDLTSAQALEAFGSFWISFAGDSSLGKLMRFSGDSFAERLASLDEMHERIKMTMPHLRPPAFDFEEGADGVHRLHYYSHRDGMSAMVIGLVHGLAQDAGENVTVRHVIKKDEGADHDEFEVTMIG